MIAHIGGIGREERIAIWRLCSDLLESGVEIERVFPLVRQMYALQGARGVARKLKDLEDAVRMGDLSEAVGDVASSSEALVFQAFGRGDAVEVFGGAERIADVENRLAVALWTNLAGPCFLVAALFGIVWGAGAFFVPALTDFYPMDTWGGWSQRAAGACVWVAEQILWIGLAAAGVAAGLFWACRWWTGWGRAVADRVVPFSWVRTVTGLAFLLAATQCVRAGLDLNERTFAALGRGGTRYARHRIAAVGANMGRGLGFGQAMAATGHGFPEPQLIAVVSALEGMPQWESRVGLFCERWSQRAERMVRARAVVANRTLLMAVGAVIVGGMSALFEVLLSVGEFL